MWKNFGKRVKTLRVMGFWNLKFYCLPSMGLKRGYFFRKILDIWKAFLTPWMRMRTSKWSQFWVNDHVSYLKKEWSWFLHPSLKYEFFPGRQKIRHKQGHFIAKFELTKHFQIAVKIFIDNFKGWEEVLNQNWGK